MESTTRLLIYSHDSFGLGHLRRCRAIAHHLVDVYPDLSVLILSGSPIIGNFDFKDRVDFVRMPGVIKLRDGEYQSQKLHLAVEETLAVRASIIRHTALTFAPDLFLVDKEPLGLRGEVEPALHDLRARGCRLVLGLRDVMDEPGALHEEWRRKGVMPALEELYHEIWVYGLPAIFDPLSELPDMDGIAHKVTFTGYLPRQASQRDSEILPDTLGNRPFILVTPGGGGDGEALIDWVLRAYEADPGLPHNALIVFGPFMPVDQRQAFQARVHALDKVEAITFEAEFEQLLERAIGVVGMGGYNTFCEILSFGKPALVVPRTVPRQEQALRALRAERLGLVHVLPDDGRREVGAMIAQLRALPGWQAPDARRVPGLLAGLDRIATLARPWLGRVPAARRLA
ncbi:glycosyltransferase family protein [Marinivivus vitaminiproducens]|uniref:glycosyltransferase family protein n=1 Tax=Marinivivus vitaminiproducens TaxID=3035935 RepID=UPI0027A4C7C1|nr:glycosyltransferase [Geminicoccaceae bacterium SCSIO 64248]